MALGRLGGFEHLNPLVHCALELGCVHERVVIVFNDNAFGNVRRDQKHRFDGRIYGSDLQNPNFMKLADAYGVRGVKAEGPDALEAALKEAVGIEAPSLIEVPVGEMPYPY